MTEEADLVAAVVTNPKEDTPRLMYADWLQDRGAPGDSDRAEFIRVQLGQLGSLGCSTPSYNEVWTDLHGGSIPEKIYYGCRSHPPCSGCDLVRTLTRYFAGTFIHKLPGGIGGAAQLVSYDDTERGFVRSLRGPAEIFLQWADSLLWHPDQTSACPECDGRREVRFCDAAGDMDDLPCERCGGSLAGGYKRGTGRVARPCPITAQPIEVVTLTSPPVNPIHWYTTRWPGVRFDVITSFAFPVEDPFPDVPWGGGL